MIKFLSKFLPKEQVDSILEAYKAVNTGSTELPKHIKQEDYEALDVQLKNIPKDWQEQLTGLQGKYEKEISEHTLTKTKVEEAKQEAILDGKLYQAKARNITAAKALIDRSKSVEDEIKRLQKDESFLFGNTKLPKGTGKDDDQEDAGEDKEKGLDDAKMRAALGLPTNK